MVPRDVRLAPLSLRAVLLLLVPLALLGTALLGLLAQSASAGHPVPPPTGLTLSPGAYGTVVSPSWTYTIPTGQTATCRLTGPSGPVDVSCPTNGTTAAQPIMPLTADGSYTFSVTTTRPDVQEPDPSDTSTVVTHSGGTSAPAESTYVLDRVAPVLVVDPPVAGTPYASTTGWTVRVTDTSPLRATTCTLSSPGGTDGSAFACSGATKPALTTSGTYVLGVTSEDAAGNPATPVSSSYAYDGVAPVVTVTRLTASPESVRQPQWTYTADDGDVTCTLVGPAGTVDGGPCAGGTYTAPVLGTSGTYTLTVRATDASGNVGEASSAYVLDITAPVITVPASSTGQGDTISWAVTITGAISGTCTVAGADTSTSSCTASSGSVTATRSTDGTITLEVRAVDAYGNAATGSVTYTVDTTEPDGPTLVRSHLGSTGSAATLGWTWTVAAGHTTQCRLTVDSVVTVGWGPCGGTFTTSTSGQGTYTLDVRYVDALLNAGTTSSDSYTFDSVGPGTPSVTLVGDPTRQPGAVTWSFSRPADAAGSECRVIGPGVDASAVAWGPCSTTTSHTASLTATGEHRLEVRHVDAAGNLSLVGAGTVTVDGTAPSAPSVSGPGGRVATGPLTWSSTHTGDGVSFVCRLVVNGSVPGELTACTSNYSVAPTVQGTYRLDVASVDAVGNVSPITSGATYTYDTVGPGAPTVTLGVTSGKTASATWTVTPAEAGQVECMLTRTAGGTTSTVTSWSACATPYTFALVGGDGVYRLHVRTYDDLLNVSAVVIGPGYTLDTTPPDAPAVSGTRDGTTGSARDVSYTYAGEGVALCSLYRGTTLVTPADAVCGPTAYTATLPVVSGTYRLEVTFTDADDNTSVPGASGDYVLDVTAPDPPDVTGDHDGETDNERAVAYAFQGEGTATCRLYRDGVLVTAPADAACTATGYTATLPAVSGSYRLEVTFTDAYGNTSAPGVSGDYVLDVTPPGSATVTVTPRTDDVESATWTVTPPEQGTTTQCRLLYEGAIVQDWHPCVAPFAYALGEGDGAYVLVVRVIDAVGNVGPAVLGQDYVVDMTAPAVPDVSSDRSGTDNERVVTYAFSGEGTATCQLTRGGVAVGIAVTCTSPWVVTLPATSGVYVLLVTYTDAVGNVGAPGASPDYVLDVTPPTAPDVSSDRSGTDNERVVTYAFSGEGTATCQLTRGGVAVGIAVTCTSPWVVTLPTTDGEYVLLVTFTDAVGNTSAAGESVAYALDLTPPPAAVVLGPPPIGNTRAVSWTYSGEGTATCQLVRDGVAYGTETACGAASFTTTLPLDGTWTLQVSFTDAVGNRGPPGTSSGYLLDTLAPVAPTLTGPTGPSPNRSPSWSIGTEAATSVECRLLRSGSVVLDWAPCAGSVAATLTGLPDGGYVLEARATDLAGNVSPVGVAATYVLDTTAPAAVVVTGPSGPSQVRTPSFTWTGEAGARAECQLGRDGVVVGGWVTCTPGHAPVLDRDGTWTLTVRLTDAAGNVSDLATSGGYVLDTTAPQTPLVTPPQTPGRELAPSWGVIVESGASMECRLSGPDGVTGAWAPCTLPHVTSLTGRPDGAYVLEVRATDTAGNLSPVGSGTYVLDTVAPAAPVVTAPAGPSRSRIPTFSFTVEPAASTRCRVTSGSTLISDYVACSASFTVDLTGLPDGAYTVTVRVSDAAGNPGPAATGTYVLDTTGPAAPVLITAPASPSPERSATWTFSHEPGATLLCRLTFPTGAVREIASCTSPLTIPLTGLPDGTYTLTVRAVDAAGNVGAVLTDTHVIDSTALAPPTVTGPVTPGSTRTPRWTFSSATATECRLARGTTVLIDWTSCATQYVAALFNQPDGTYALSVRSIANGQVSAAATSRYVLDTTGPGAAAITAPPTPSTNLRPVWSIASVELGATAECRLLYFGSVIRDWAPCSVTPAGSLFDQLDLTDASDGTYTLVVRLTDAARNLGPEVSSAYVLDTSAPVGVGVTGPPSPGNDTSPTWTFTTAGDLVLECRLTSDAVVVSDWDTCEGSFTADLTDLPDGVYFLSVRAVSEAGTPGPETTVPYTLSTLAPDGPTLLVLSGTKPVDNDRSPTWTFTLPSGTTGRCVLVQGTITIADQACNGRFVADLSRASDGSYTLSVYAVDEAGSESEPATSTYRLDVSAPSSPTFTLVPGSPGSTLTPQWRFTTVHGSTTECRVRFGSAAPGDWTPCTSPYDLDLTLRPDGEYVLEVRAVDDAGNSSPPRSSTYVLDRTAAPVAAFTSTPESPSRDRTVVWTFTAPEGYTLECRLTGPGGATGWESCGTATAALRIAGSLVVGSTGSYAVDLADRPNGEYVLEVRVVDALGNRGSVSRATYWLDTRAPEPPTFSAPAPAAGKDPRPSWSWETTGDDWVECRLLRNGVEVQGWAECTSPYEARLTSQGTYRLEIRLVDGAGNRSGATGSSYVFDTTPPDRPVLVGPPSSGSDRTVSWTFAMPPGTTATCTVTRGLNRVDERACNGGRYDLDLTGQPDGTYTLTVRFTDAAGNLSLPGSGSYALRTVGLPGRVVAPPTSGPAPAAPSGPGRGGTGVVVVPPQGSTPRPGVPTIPGDDDVPRAGAGRPASTATPGDEREEAAGGSAPDAAASGRDPLIADPFPFDKLAPVIREAVTGTITRPTLPLALLAIVVLFLLAQNRIDRRDPKLASAPVEAEPELDFTLIVRRPEGSLS